MHDDIADLEQQIEREQTVLAQYENLLRLEEDPRRIMRLQENVEECHHRLRTLQVRIAQLRLEQLPAPQPSGGDPILLTNFPYGLEGHFVGREDETLLLDDWFHRDPDHPLLAVIGLGGSGKSALTWRWLQQVVRDGHAPPLVVWWSFYETDGTLHKMLLAILDHCGIDTRRLQSLRQLYNTFAVLAQQRSLLLVLDGAERLLRAYGSLGAAYQGDEDDPALRERARECLDPVADGLLRWLAQPVGRAKTLMTSRLLPTALQGRTGGLLAGVRRHDLTGLSPAAARRLFDELGVVATRAEIEAVCQPLGYHPLSLSLLARWLASDPHGGGDIRNAVQYDPTHGLLGKREHVLRRVYDTLPEAAQTLLGQLAALRSGVTWETIAQAFGDRRDALWLLQQRGLVQTSDGVVDLHPIVRRYAYERLRDPTATHAQLVAVFEAAPPPPKVRELADLRPAIELYHHLARAGRFDEAFTLFRDRLATPLYYQLGAYRTRIALLRVLFVDGEAALPRLTSERDQGWTLNGLANSYALAGQPRAAIPLFEQGNQINERRGDKGNLAVGLGNVADDQMKIGRLQPAAANLRRRITLGREIEDRFQEAVGHKQLGRVLAQCGAWDEAEAALESSTIYWYETDDWQGLSLDWAYRAELALLRGRGDGDAADAQAAARQALHFAEETARTTYPLERDFVQCHWLLGWAALAVARQAGAAAARTEALAAGERHLDEALRRCRAIDLVDHEAPILLAQARLAVARGDAAARVVALLDEAQPIAERSGYVLVLADIHNERAALALAAGERRAARDHARRARDYAWCDGPPFAYQSALDRADGLLAGL